MKSKDQKKIEKITMERDHWRKLYEACKEEVEELKRHNERLKIFSSVNTISLTAGQQELEKRIDEIQRQRNEAINLLVEYESRKLQSQVPIVTQALQKPLEEDIRIVFGVNVIINGEEHEIITNMIDLSFNNDLEQIIPYLERHIARFLIHDILQIPLQADIDSWYETYIQSYTDEITQGDLLILFLELHQAWTEEAKKEVKDRWRDKIWDAVKDNDYPYIRDDFTGRFSNFVNRSIEKIEKRLRQKNIFL